MLISARYRGDSWAVDENTANLIPEFRELLQTSTLGVKAMAFVSLAFDPTSFLYAVYEDEESRKKQAYTTVYEGGGKIDLLLKNKSVKAAIQRYEELCDTAGVKLRQQYREGIKAVGKYLEDNKDDLTKSNFDKYISAIEKMPKLIQQFMEMEKGDQSDIEDTKTIISGGRALTYREQKLQKSRNKK